MEFRKTKSVLNLIWYSTLPGAFILFTAALHLTLFRDGQPGLVGDELAGLAPWILVAVTVAGFGLALFFKQNFLPGRAAAMAGKASPEQQLKSLVMTQLGVSDAPCAVGVAFYVMTGQDWIAAGIIVYAFLASALFKPDFDRLYAALNGSRTY